MASLLPHISVVVNHTKAMSKLVPICGFLNLLCCFQSLWLWLDAIPSDLVSQALQVILSKEAHVCIGMEASLLWATQNLLDFLWMVFKCAITDDECVINVVAGTIQVTKWVHHNLLEFVWTILDSQML